MTRRRRSFKPISKREAAGLVIDQDCSHVGVSRSLELVESALG